MKEKNLYSIWVVPPEPLFATLNNIIIDLAQKYNGPLFKPHMTVLGGILAALPEIQASLEQLTQTMKPLDLSLGPVSFSTTHYQNVFVRVNPTAELLSINLEAKKLFGMENDVFMPHISLLYGEQDMATREQAVQRIYLPSESFAASELVIVPALPNPKDWNTVLSLPFKG